MRAHASTPHGSELHGTQHRIRGTQHRIRGTSSRRWTHPHDSNRPLKRRLLLALSWLLVQRRKAARRRHHKRGTRGGEGTRGKATERNGAPSEKKRNTRGQVMGWHNQSWARFAALHTHSQKRASMCGNARSASRTATIRLPVGSGSLGIFHPGFARARERERVELRTRSERRVQVCLCACTHDALTIGEDAHAAIAAANELHRLVGR